MAVILSRKSGGGSSSGGGAPSGPAGGDLTGTYPNPTIAAAYTAARVSNAIVDAKGDLIVATAADTVARKAVGATNGMHLEAQSGQSDGLLWALPQGFLFSYVEFTSTVTISATSDATANTIVTAAGVAFDGSTLACVEFYSPSAVSSPTDNAILVLNLYDGSTDLGRMFLLNTVGLESQDAGCLVRRYLTPSAATHTYSIRGWSTTVGSGNGAVQGGAGGTATNLPGYIRVTKG